MTQRKTDDPLYFKKYYQLNKDKIKDNSKRAYLKKKGFFTDIRVEIKHQPVILSFD
jgi:hypothetical protein